MRFVSIHQIATTSMAWLRDAAAPCSHLIVLSLELQIMLYLDLLILEGREQYTGIYFLSS